MSKQRSGAESTGPTDRALLLVTSNYPRWEGDSTTPFVLHLAQDLQQHGWDVDVLAPHAPGAQRHEQLGGITVRRFRYFWPDSQQTVCYGGGALVNLRQRRSNLAKLPFLVAAEWASLRRQISSKRYAAVHAHWILPQGFVTGLLSGRRVPRILSVHGSDIFGLQSSSLIRFKRFALRRADAVTVNSSATEQAVRELQPVDRLVNIPMGVDESEPRASLVQQVRARHRRGDGPFIVFLGRVVEEKGVGDLLEALIQVRRDHPDVSALILGEGQDRSLFEQRAAVLGLDSAITFHGWVKPDEVPSYLAAADLFVAPSRSEGQGLTVAEAMVAGVPVVATRVGGFVDAVRDGETGTLVPERSPDQIAAAIGKLVDNPSIAAEMAKRGQIFARQHFGRRQSAQRFSDLFDEIIAQHHR